MPFHQDVHETIMAERETGGMPVCPDCGGWGEHTRQCPRFREDIPVCDRACDGREAIEQGGYDCDCTPIDVLMGDPGLGYSVAWAMEHGDEPFEG